jgi:hypothetical protein
MTCLGETLPTRGEFRPGPPRAKAQVMKKKKKIKILCTQINIKAKKTINMYLKHKIAS